MRRGLGPDRGAALSRAWLLALAVLLVACGAPTPLAGRALVSSPYRLARLADPPRTVVTDDAYHWLATFTDGARTVALLGPVRTLAEPSAPHPVVTTTWVRLLPAPFAGTPDDRWLDRALADRSPDILAIAAQYIADAPPVIDADGQQIAGRAFYGPARPDGTRDEGGDFNDYLGVPWTFPEGTRAPQPAFARSLDCSGYMRMVWGYRAGVPLGYAPDTTTALPRHSWEIAAAAPGIVLIPDTGAQVTDLAALDPGDLVFFDAKDDAHSTRLDHVGMYLGRDAAGGYRFISSRQKQNGPTFGDVGGASLLDGTGLYARSFRAARRL